MQRCNKYFENHHLCEHDRNNFNLLAKQPMTTSKTLQVAISNITIWRKGDQRVPHKPLLLLYILSEYKKDHDRLFNYGNETHQPLLDLLTCFGPKRRAHYPTMPFWRLQGDGFWE